MQVFAAHSQIDMNLTDLLGEPQSGPVACTSVERAWHPLVLPCPLL